MKISQINTIQVTQNNWVAKTVFFNPNKIEIEMKGNSQENAYEKLKDFLKIKKSPRSIQRLPNGNKIYKF